MLFDYFYGSEAEQFSFYRIPKKLFKDEEFKRISAEAKVLYGLMLDRMGLSVKNRWLDDENRVYIIYTIDDITEDFGCARQKAAKLLNELEKDAGLIERKRQGLGKPNIIYVKNFVSSNGENQEVCKSNFQKYENHTSRNMNTILQEVPKSYSNNTNINNTEINKTNCNNIPCDIFKCLENGNVYIPAENELFEYTGEYKPYTEKSHTEPKKHKDMER